MKHGRIVRLVSDDEAARIAHIIGGSSAMAQALADRDRRREAGEDPVIVMADSSVLVVPRSALAPH